MSDLLHSNKHSGVTARVAHCFQLVIVMLLNQFSFTTHYNTEVVAAHHRVHDHACCHLQADCLESGISSGHTLDYEYGYLYLTFTLTNE